MPEELRVSAAIRVRVSDGSGDEASEAKEPRELVETPTGRAFDRAGFTGDSSARDRLGVANGSSLSSEADILRYELADWLLAIAAAFWGELSEREGLEVFGVMFPID